VRPTENRRMPALYEFEDAQIRTLEQQLRAYLRGEVSHEAVARAAWSVMDAWNALPEEYRKGEPEAHEDVLWHAVWTTQHLADAEHMSDASGVAQLHECLHLLESRGPLPPHYRAQRP
ncbi:MAG: hypothetical protein M3P51_11265, partial [Chloroflexota bacterium]|nr:hypothetical protein [Chloroflexota bacterium]